jgi:hypothetical protein
MGQASRADPRATETPCFFDDGAGTIPGCGGTASEDKSMLKVEQLYFGDKRLDALKDEIINVIVSRCEGQNIPVVSVLGILNLVEDDLKEMMEE